MTELGDIKPIDKSNGRSIFSLYCLKVGGMNSMTGFGRAELRTEKIHVQVELASVNSRYLETIFRMPRVLAGFESQIKELLTEKISRGKVTITVNMEESPVSAIESMIDPEVAEAYYNHLCNLKKRLNIHGDVTMEHLLANPQMLGAVNQGLEDDDLWPNLKKLIETALAEMIKMRQSEGRNLKKDMTERLKHVTDMVRHIEKLAPENVATYRERLEKRVKEIGNGVEIDPQRLAEEVTVYADRSDVTEECIRLKSHVKMFRETLKDHAEAGKRLNFILQEMGRESNTIGSKSLSSETARHAIELKEEIEKLREQVQNIE